jgi:hypothetical protein
MRSLATLLVALPMLTGTIVVTGATHAEEHAVAGPANRRGAIRVQPMTEDRFWTLVGTTTAFESDPERQLSALRASLERLSIEDIEAYEATFDEQMRRSYSWDLWGAAYVVHGGASDDGFEYFRCWLISKGRGVFERVIADPDSLGDILVPNVKGVLEFEDFAYVARQVWGQKTGHSSNRMPNAANMIYPDLEPSGTKFEEDAAHLAKRYPKLWRRFGTHPLG